MHLYITGDAIGTPTGGGKVTFHESQALIATGEDTIVWSFPNAARPWGPDIEASARLIADPTLRPERAHFYSGTFIETIKILKSRGTFVSYTAAAHDIQISREEHEKLGLSYDYPHLTDPALWRKYVEGYVLADVVICPSGYSAGIMKGYGCGRVFVIPHGYDPVDRIAPFPKRFTVGYLGQPGPDKGLRYLIEAWSVWSSMTPTVDTQLVIAGRGTEALLPLVQAQPRGVFYLRGEVAEPRDLYDACCVYVQPSASEGFGCEVLEARAHGRPVICSEGAGAAPFANCVVRPRNVSAIASKIDHYYQGWLRDPKSLETSAPRGFTWAEIRSQYTEFFKS